jgi:Inner membrane component of T3SS, cytoplasmic domain
MVAFKCRYCGKSYHLEFLPIPDEGAEFQCAKCGKTNKLMKRGKVVYCLESDQPEHREQSSTLNHNGLFRSREHDDLEPEELEARLQGMYVELPYDIEFQLGILEGPDQGIMHQMTKPIMTIGKTGCDINLADAKVSRQHCQIEIYGKQMIILRDLDSVGGTFRNDFPTSLAYLQPGDKILLGKTKLVLIQIQKKLSK